MARPPTPRRPSVAGRAPPPMAGARTAAGRGRPRRPPAGRQPPPKLRRQRPARSSSGADAPPRAGKSRGFGAGAVRRFPGLQNLPDAYRQALDLLLPIAEQIDPLPGGELIGEGVIGGDILDADRDDGDAMPPGEHQLFLDLVGIVGVGGEHQQHDLRRTQRLHDRFLKILPGTNVAARYPALMPARLQRPANRFRHVLIFGRIADEDRCAHDPKVPLARIGCNEPVRFQRCSALAFSNGNGRERQDAVTVIPEWGFSPRVANPLSTRAGIMDSGLRPSAGPGMTRHLA